MFAPGRERNGGKGRMDPKMDDLTGGSEKIIKSAASIILGRQDMSLMDKLGILADAAKYDVACTSSGVDQIGRAHV